MNEIPQSVQKSSDFYQAEADIYQPFGEKRGLQDTTHLGIGAHPDDLEIMAFEGISQSIANKSLWFSGVTCTTGSGGVQGTKENPLTPHDLAKARAEEQREAARRGHYATMVQLGYESNEIAGGNPHLTSDLRKIILSAYPSVIYTHSPFDRHPTHLATLYHVIEAARTLESAFQPEKVLGCEVWGSLDWLIDMDKVALNVSGHDRLAKGLLDSFPSQTKFGKKLDRATLARRQANATFQRYDRIDDATSLIHAVDLTPLIKDPSIDIVDYAQEFIERFQNDIRMRWHGIGKKNG